MDVVVKRIFKVNEIYEISVDTEDSNFLIIYGHHINGWFIAILNWKVCTEAGHPTSVEYNAGKLDGFLGDSTLSIKLSNAICSHWEYYKVSVLHSKEG